MNDPYLVLGLQRSASDDEVKSAFRKLAKTCHPDLHPNDPKAEKRFKEINAAYEAINKGETSQEHPQFRQGAFRFEDIFSSMGPGGNAWEEMFGNIRAHQRNSDMHLQINISLEEIFYGKELDVQIPLDRGVPKVVKIKIPAGAMNGWRICMQRAGSQGNSALPPGDLYFLINVKPHERFTRDVNNITTMIPVDVFEVMLGKEVEVMGIDNNILKVSIPSGFDSSRKLRLAGQGMPDPHTGVRGDLLIDLFVQYPALSDEQRILIEKASDLPKVNA